MDFPQNKLPEILIISKYASSKEVGYETRLFSLSRHLVPKVSAITIVSSDSNHFAKFPNYTKTYNYQEIQGIRTFWIKTLKYKKTISIRRVLSWLDFEWKLFFMDKKKLGNPDVIIVSSLSLLTILNGLRLKTKLKAKLIFEIRDIWPLTLVEEGGYSNRNLFVKVLSWIEKHGYLKSDLVIGTMPNLKQHVDQVTNKKINCKCVPFGFEPEQYSYNEDDSVLADKFFIPENKFIVGYAGSIGLTNGLDTFINVIKRLEHDPDIYFVIIGDGALREKYMEFLKNCSNVLFTNRVERKVVRYILAKCDVLYFAALKSKVWDFGWSPNKLIDYMISGKPLIASYSGFPSMINEAGSGVFVPAEDEGSLIQAIKEFAAKPSSELTIMGEKGKAWLIENRQWPRLADDYFKIIEELIPQQSK
jgi:glycosyltransferase involved in cell wall biosynthesis